MEAETMADRQYSLRGAVLVTPKNILTDKVLTVSGRHIADWDISASFTLDVQDCLVFPGLLNGHDHLNGTWWPRVGPNRPYTNVYGWLADLDASPVRYDRQQNSVEDIYELGMYRNLISGVTTVADHFWRIDVSDFYSRHPIDVLYKYGRTWTPRELTKWGDDLPTEYGNAVRDGQPYIIHLAEGLDEQTSNEMDVLLEYNALGRNTMIIHGVSLRPQDMRMMAQVGASLCWCPESNFYLYGQTADIRALLDARVHVTIGTDSSLTGALNLLDEVRVARRAYRQQTGQDPSSRWLVELMTTHAAYALMLEDRRGQIAPGYEADLLLLKQSHADPYTTLIEADVADIQLLICQGIPVYGDSIYQSLFEQYSPGFKPVTIADTSKLVAGDLPGLIQRMFSTVGRNINFPFLPCTKTACAS